MEGEEDMAKSRKQKNQKIYEELENELKNNKGDNYEEKLRTIDPHLDSKGEVELVEKKMNIVKRNEHKNNNSLTVISKKLNGDKADKNNSLVEVKKEKKAEKKKTEAEIIEEEIFNEPISYTDKLSIEELLRTKLENQQKIKDDKKGGKRSPNDDKYTPEMMQKRIKPHIGVDVRKEVKLSHKDNRWMALTVLIVALVLVIAIGVMLIFKVI